jgi:membrane protein
MFKKIKHIGFEAIKSWYEDDAFKLAAALAYYTLFALGPLLLVATSVAGIFFGEEAARGELSARLGLIMGDVASHALEAFLAETGNASRSRTTTLIGGGILLIAATTAFMELRRDINRIWGVEVANLPHVGAYFLKRFLSFLMVVGVGLLLVVSLIISTLIATTSDFLSHRFDLPLEVFGWFNGLISYFLVGLVFTLIFKLLPEKKVHWSSALVGALVTSVLFLIGTYGIGLYLGTSIFASAYGASASVIMILVWTYYSTLILFFGAEVTKVLQQSSGEGVVA